MCIATNPGPFGIQQFIINNEEPLYSPIQANTLIFHRPSASLRRVMMDLGVPTVVAPKRVLSWLKKHEIIGEGCHRTNLVTAQGMSRIAKQWKFNKVAEAFDAAATETAKTDTKDESTAISAPLDPIPVQERTMMMPPPPPPTRQDHRPAVMDVPPIPPPTTTIVYDSDPKERKQGTGASKPPFFTRKPMMNAPQGNERTRPKTVISAAVPPPTPIPFIQENRLPEVSERTEIVRERRERTKKEETPPSEKVSEGGGVVFPSLPPMVEILSETSSEEPMDVDTSETKEDMDHKSEKTPDGDQSPDATTPQRPELPPVFPRPTSNPLTHKGSGLPHKGPPKTIQSKSVPTMHHPILHELIEQGILTEEQALQYQPTPSLSSTDVDETTDVPTVTKPRRRVRGYILPETAFSSTLQAQWGQMERFWLEDVVLSRQSAAISPSTLQKTQERIRGYLGWLRTSKDISTPTLDHCEDEENIEAFLTFLREERRLEASTLGFYCQAFVNVAKWKHATKANRDFRNILLIQRLQIRRNAYLREPKSQYQESWEGKAEEGKYLPWEEVLDVLEQLKREKENAEEGSDLKAMRTRDYVALLLYTALPPSRSKDIYALEMGKTMCLNPLTKTWEMGTKVSTHDASKRLSKTERSTGASFFAFDDPALSFVVEAINEYVDEARPVLLPGGFHPTNHVFVTDTGIPYQSWSWTTYLQSIFAQRSTQSKISVNALRSSLVTHLYGQDDVSPQLRESMALGMKSSVRKAQEVYDRRTITEKKRKAVQYTSKLVRRKLGLDPEDYEQEDRVLPAPGDLCATVNSQNDILFGKVLRNMAEDNVLLAYLKPTTQEKGKEQETQGLHVRQETGSSFIESVEALIFPVDHMLEETTGIYRILATRASILEAFSEGGEGK